MDRLIVIPNEIHLSLINYFFQNLIEQGAFLYANYRELKNQKILEVFDYYLIPKSGWQFQSEVHLEMKDTERAKLLHKARLQNCTIIDCHSHPQSFNKVAFSPSDIYGITLFADYVKWKLDKKPFCSMVWGEMSTDAVYFNELSCPEPVDSIFITGTEKKSIIPRGTWFKRNKSFYYDR